MKKRCEWVSDDPLYIQYHDHEWGVPVHDDQKLFEMLVLECAQAGLSWITILHKREGYKKCFKNFVVENVAMMTDKELNLILKDAAIVRNTLKVYSVRQNAQSVINIQKEYESFDAYLWAFVENTPMQNTWKNFSDVPKSTKLSETISKDLKKHGCTFVGPTVIYAYMQAIGMVNDHTTDCFRWKELH
ncbi:MAG: DNA-3-methyladenine glycosylase I [Candidatus Moraniibacteriota bacterium]|nr:MAG: DNA-3-methyladenine glycosylase I [Candidatus Moranbacteria bacterium]